VNKGIIEPIEEVVLYSSAWATSASCLRCITTNCWYYSISGY